MVSSRFDVEKIIGMRKEGKSLYEIGDAVGCSASNVRRILINRGMYSQYKRSRLQIRMEKFNLEVLDYKNLKTNATFRCKVCGNEFKYYPMNITYLQQTPCRVCLPSPLIANGRITHTIRTEEEIFKKVRSVLVSKFNNKHTIDALVNAEMIVSELLKEYKYRKINIICATAVYYLDVYTISDISRLFEVAPASIRILRDLVDGLI